jgi:hypothetical protein
VSSHCHINATANYVYKTWLDLTLYLISATRNEFTAIGCNTLALLQGPSYYSGCITSCVSLDAAARDGDRCTGLGYCQTSIPQSLRHILVSWGTTSRKNTSGNPVWTFSPCSYAFVAEKGWYVTTHKQQAIVHGELCSSVYVGLIDIFQGKNVV